MDRFQLKKLILDTIEHLRNCHLTPDACFYTKFQEYLEVLQDDLFEHDSRSIIASCELLKTITNDINPDKRLKQQLKRESAIMLTSLRMHMKAKKKVYTPLQILLKLEILFEPILDHSRICHDTYAELKNTIVKTKDEELLESIVLRERKKRPMFLREITDAILDDIIDFLQKQNKTFYDFYNDYRISYIVFRLENYADYLETSIYVYDKLCVFISKHLTDKYKLDGKCLAQLIRDQFENTDQSVYRMKLTDFVDKFTNECFTFDKFFEYIQEESVLTKEEEKIYALLFEIYCKKLSGLLPTAPSQTPPASPRNSFSNDQVPTSTTKQSFRQKKPRKDQSKYSYQRFFFFSFKLFICDVRNNNWCGESRFSSRSRTKNSKKTKKLYGSFV